MKCGIYQIRNIVTGKVYSKLSKEFNIAQGSIQKIIENKIWKTN